MRFFIFPLFLFVFAINLFSQSLQEDPLITKSKKFLNLVVNQEYDQAVEIFDSPMTAVFSAEKLEASWAGIQQQVGKFDKIVKELATVFNDKDVIVLTVKFEKMHIDVRCVYDSLGMMAGLFFAPNYEFTDYKAPDYVDRTSFDEIKVSFGKEGWELNGILTMPVKDPNNKTQLFPVVILVAGSGPNDMDESIGPNKPFKDIAWGLASKGIAVFRYNKRTMEHAAKVVNNIEDFTLYDEVIEDVMFAIDKMVNMPDINPKYIYVLGHSLGGMSIPRIAEKDKALAGFIVMAGNARPLQKLLEDQYVYLFSEDGEISEKEQEKIDTVRVQVARIESGKVTKDTPMNLMPFNTPPLYWIDLKDYYAAEVAKNIKAKMLVIQGARDYQVTTKEFELWKKALKGKKKVEFKLYPKLNHLFLEGEGKSYPEEYMNEGHIPAYVIDDIVGFVKK